MSETLDYKITVEKRDGIGKAEAGRFRREGKIPAVLYGGGKPPVAITVGEDDINEIRRSRGGENTIFVLKLKGGSEERRAMIKEAQVDPMTGRLVHLDFIRVMRGHKLNVSVPIELDGDCVGVREGGRLDFVTREVAVEILPREMIESIVVDVSNLNISDSVTIADLEDKLPESGAFLEDESRIIVQVSAPRSEAEFEEEAEEGLDLMVEESAEPEVIGKGKDEEAED